MYCTVGTMSFSENFKPLPVQTWPPRPLPLQVLPSFVTETVTPHPPAHLQEVHENFDARCATMSLNTTFARPLILYTGSDSMIFVPAAHGWLHCGCTWAPLASVHSAPPSEGRISGGSDECS